MDYESNKKSWMTRAIFHKRLKRIDAQMRGQKRKIVLFVDNCSGHTDVPPLTNVQVRFLPSNTTSELQPTDQGIINSFKCRYRCDVVLHVLAALETYSDPKINVLQVQQFEATLAVAAAIVERHIAFPSKELVLTFTCSKITLTLEPEAF